VARRGRKHQDLLSAPRPHARDEEQRGVAVDPRRNLLALRAVQKSAGRLRAEAIRELSHQHGNQFVQRSLAARTAPVQVTASPGAIAREATEEASAVTISGSTTKATYAVTGKTLADAFKSIQKYAKSHSGEAASVTWNPRWTATAGDDGYISKITVTPSIVKTMPSWPGAKDLSTAASAEWDRVYGELDAHENRHLEILENGATYIGNSAIGMKKKDGEKAANDAKNSINADNVSIDPFFTDMTTDIE